MKKPPRKKPLQKKPFRRPPATALKLPVDPASILEGLPDGVLVTDTDWQIRYVNKALLRLLECSEKDLLGLHLPLLPDKTGRGDSSSEISDYLAHLTSSPPEQTEVKTVSVPTPARKFIRITTQPYRPSRSATAGYILTFADATREGEIDEMKSEFISVASHELRTPMTSIKGSLELLLGGYAGEMPHEANELLEISLTAVDRLIRLVNDVLDIAKIESGKMEFHLAHLNVAECIEKSLRSIRSLAEAHHVSFQTEQPENIPSVFADRDRLEQIITNLLSNALKYSPANSVVHIRTSSRNDIVRISVTDKGPGVPPSKIHKVFDRFQQLEGAKKGSGLGLAICRALVEQQRGKIWVESIPGHGAEFHFELPTAPAD